MVNPTTTSMKKYGAVGSFSANTALKISEYKDLSLETTSEPYFKKDTNGTKLVGRIGMIIGGKFTTKTTAKQCQSPIGIIMAPDIVDPADLQGHNIGEYAPLSRIVTESSKNIIPSYPIAVRGVVAVYVKNASNFKAGDIVCFKNEELGKSGGEIKIVPISDTGDFKVDSGYLATSARVWDTQSFGDQTKQSDILWIQINDNQAPAPTPITATV